ncbi:MAG: small multi-drug export protein [Oscillospiraceae bacterium]|nr:small multi-drug export protein [Oscillospiraceae bacterium]
MNPYFVLFGMSMLPVSELRGAIIYAAANGLPFLPSYIIAVIGNFLPVCFLILFSKRLLNWLSTLPKVGGFFRRYLQRANEKALNIGRYELLGLCLFVAIPLPMTGAWTGSVIAAILQLRLKPSAAAVLCGICISGIVMGIVSYGISGLLALI